MPAQAFSLGQSNGCGAKATQPFGLIFLHGYNFQKIHYAEAPAHAREAAGGQRVVWARDVIAEGLRGISAYKDGAGILYPREVFYRVYG